MKGEIPKAFTTFGDSLRSFIIDETVNEALRWYIKGGQF